MRYRLPVMAAFLSVVLSVPALGRQTSLTYLDFLKQLTDLERLTRLMPGVQAGLASSWDRGGLQVWGANGDAGHYIREEPNGEAVMMDADGPGCIYRIWSANPQGTIRVYLDGAETPTFEWDFNALFKGGIPPFEKPLVWQRADRQASDCYLPIPFAKHIKITADKKHGQYYQFNYLTFPKDWQVASFRLPLTGEEQGALGQAAVLWGKPGIDPKTRMQGQKTETRNLEIAPGNSATLLDVQGPGMIRAIRLFAASEQRYVWRKLVLKGTWDGAGWPQVLSPIGPFFGFDWDTAEYASVPVGCRDGTAYAYWPMPFQKRAKLEIENLLERPARVAVEIEWAPTPNLPTDSAYFYARWRSEPDSMTFDYPFLETAGRGHFVGVAMPIDHPLPGWWGEGDEKVWVDDDDWPRFVGTGSEDYFGDAWGIRYLNGPSWGCSAQTTHRTCNYRWHFMDLIPFEKRMRMTIENYGPNGVGPRGHYEYTSTAFWYQAEATPPFAQLRAATFTGGDDPLGKPEKRSYGAQLFRNIDAQSVRTYGAGIPFALEAEDVLRAAARQGVGHIVSDTGERYELSRERGVDFGDTQPGAILAGFTLTASSPGVYRPHIVLAPVENPAEVSFEVGGKWCEIVARPDNHTLTLAPILIPADGLPTKLVGSKAGRAIVDAFRLEPVARAQGAMEAEDVAVVAVSDGAPKPAASDPMDGVSAGRVLEWHAEHIGQALTVQLPKAAALPYVLGVRPMMGPGAAIIQAFAFGKAIGPELDLYAPTKRPSDMVLPLGSIAQGATEVEIRIVGKNSGSQAFHVGLDYFRWEPQFVSSDSAPGVWGTVTGARGCAYEPQAIGHASAGHHLWVQPSSRGAYVDLAIQIPRDGAYSLALRLTKSWDYAIVQAELDGKEVGPRVDCYSPTVVPEPTTSLGSANLKAGRHLLRIKAVDKNSESRGYLMGIDDVIVQEVR